MELGCTTIEKSVIPKMGGGRNGEAIREEEGGHHGSGYCLEKKAQRVARCHCLEGGHRLGLGLFNPSLS